MLVSGCVSDNADMAFQSFQSTAQSQMSPSAYDSWMRVPVTSTGSP